LLADVLRRLREYGRLLDLAVPRDLRGVMAEAVFNVRPILVAKRADGAQPTFSELILPPALLQIPDGQKRRLTPLDRNPSTKGV